MDEATARAKERLDAIEHKLYALQYAKFQVEDNGLTIEPRGSAEGRGETLAVMERLFDETLLSDELSDAIAQLRASENELDEVVLGRLHALEREREQRLGVPPELREEFNRLFSKVGAAWPALKAASDWETFAPMLDSMVDVNIRIAQAKRPDADPYDTMLDANERGASREVVDAFFTQVKESVVPLMAEINARGWQPSRACIEGSFDVATQWELARDIATLEGLSPEQVRITPTEHPFSDSYDLKHGLIAAHVYEDDVTSNVFSTFHEGGHCSYGMGADEAFRFTLCAGGINGAMHEAQSRFMENYVGRAEAFAPVLLRLIDARFPGRMDGVSPREFYLATNRAVAQPLRTHADELTYPLHVLLRYEIEQLLIAGEATAKDVPALWEARVRDYLGIEVPDHGRGALQDAHWAWGMFGYFPSYALGSAYGAQLLDAMRADGVAFDDALAAGELSPITGWLRAHVWRYGRSLDSGEVLRRACGGPFDASHYTSYLVRKFSDIYGL